MGGFPFGGGYFGLYSHTTGVVPPTPVDEASGQGRRRPFPIFQVVEGTIDFWFHEFEAQLRGRVLATIPGTVFLQFEALLGHIAPTVPGMTSVQMAAFAGELAGLSIDPTTGQALSSVPHMIARAHGWYADKHLTEDVRILRALQALPADRRADLMRQLVAVWSDLEKN